MLYKQWTSLIYTFGIMMLLPCSINAATQPVTTRISVSSNGAQSNNDSRERPAISADGRYVAFSSLATNLVANDTNGASDIFIHDRQTGQTTRVSVDNVGNQGNGNSILPGLSADGRFVAFISDATNLVTGDTNGKSDVFVHDRTTQTTTRVSVTNTGAESGGDCIPVATPSEPSHPSLSADGRYVAFSCKGSTFTTQWDFNNGYDIFVRDRTAGKTYLVSSIPANTGVGNGDSDNPVISADGRYVAFNSTADNLITGDTNGGVDVFVRDLVLNQTTRVSVSSNGTQGNDWSRNSSISADGRYVAFSSLATNLVTGDTNSDEDIFVHDRQTQTTTRISVDSSGQELNGNSYMPFISANGQHITFTLSDGSIFNVLNHNRHTGKTTMVSVTPDGKNGGDQSSTRSSISANGRYVAFRSAATDLIAGDTNGKYDTFVRGPFADFPWPMFLPAITHKK
jgi:Tol biopolymer transport system component